MSYLEVNIAGFRKILKQFGKQLPEYVSTLSIRDYRCLAHRVRATYDRVNRLRHDLEDAIILLSSARSSLPEITLGTETLDALSSCPSSVDYMNPVSNIKHHYVKSLGEISSLTKVERFPE